MTTLYHIADWSKHFENNRTRELKHMTFACIPNKLDGDGYTELLDHPDGAAHYGAWIALVLVASKCDPRGTLVRDGGKPHCPRSLERISRIPTKIWTEALLRLASIGWLRAEVCDAQEDTQIPQDGAETCRDDCGPRVRAQNGREGKGREQNGSESFASSTLEKAKPRKSSGDPEGFAEFWEAYPARNGRKPGRKAAVEAYGKLACEDRALCLEAVRNYARETQAQDRFPKDAERFLKKDFWRDWLGEAAPSSQKSSGLDFSQLPPDDDQ